jgi:hypothetical protein
LKIFRNDRRQGHSCGVSVENEDPVHHCADTRLLPVEIVASVSFGTVTSILMRSLRLGICKSLIAANVALAYVDRFGATSKGAYDYRFTVSLWWGLRWRLYLNYSRTRYGDWRDIRTIDTNFDICVPVSTTVRGLKGRVETWWHVAPSAVGYQRYQHSSQGSERTVVKIKNEGTCRLSEVSTLNFRMRTDPTDPEIP